MVPEEIGSEKELKAVYDNHIANGGTFNHKNNKGKDISVPAKSG